MLKACQHGIWAIDGHRGLLHQGSALIHWSARQPREGGPHQRTPVQRHSKLLRRLLSLLRINHCHY